MAACPGRHVSALRVRDRYGDNGLVGVAIVEDNGEAAEIDTLLLSCRVIGRGVETAMVAHLAAQARVRGLRRLEGWFLPTRKNAPARDFYATHGFSQIEQSDAGSRWSVDLDSGVPNFPDWIRLR